MSKVTDELIQMYRKKIVDQASIISALEQENALLNEEISHMRNQRKMSFFSKN